MPAKALQQPPRKDDPRFDDWVTELYRKVTQSDRVADIAAVTTAASSAINTTETIVVGGLSNAKVAAHTLKVGTTIRVLLRGTCTASAARVSTFRIRFGVAGTTSDGAIATAATAASPTTGTAIPFVVEILFTVRTVGATGTIAGTFSLVNQGVTGISATETQVIALTAAAIDTTVDSWISATYVSATTATCTCTFQNGIIEVVKE
jgi:hypothetical protein